MKQTILTVTSLTVTSVLFLFLLSPLLVGFGGSIAPHNSSHQQPQLQSNPQPQPPPQSQQHDTATVFSPEKPLIEFSLTDTKNRPFKNASLLGHWTVLFFGYSDCPEICPRTLAMVSELWRSFPEQTPHPKAQFVFVSLNSGSDTVPKLKEFLTRFNPSFIGLMGAEEEVNKLAKACRIYQWTDSKLDAKGNKIIDHSATLLLINPKGELMALFSPPYDPSALSKELQKLMKP